MRMQVGVMPTTLAGRSLARSKMTEVIRVSCIEHGGLKRPAVGKNSNGPSDELPSDVEADRCPPPLQVAWRGRR